MEEFDLKKLMSDMQGEKVCPVSYTHLTLPTA